MYESGEIKLTGFDELAKALKQLPGEIQKKFLYTAVQQGAKVIKDAAEANLSFKGSTKSGPSIGIRLKRGANVQIAIAHIGPLLKRWYLIFREFGTSQHTVKATKKKVLAESRDIGLGLSEYHQASLARRFSGGIIFGKQVEIPSQPTRPFLRPAFDQNKERSISAIGNYLGPKIEAEASKLAK